MTQFKTTTCHKCAGEGFTLEYPSISYHMQDKIEKQCDVCHGWGEYLWLPRTLRELVDKDVETELKIKFKGGKI